MEGCEDCDGKGWEIGGCVVGYVFVSISVGKIGLEMEIEVLRFWEVCSVVGVSFVRYRKGPPKHVSALVDGVAGIHCQWFELVRCSQLVRAF